MTFARFAQFLALALPLIFASQAKATQVTYGNYWDDNGIGTNCANTCTVYFAQVPHNKLLLATHVACQARATIPITEVTLGINTTPTGGALDRTHPLQLPQPVVASGFNWIQINHPINFLIGQGRYPFITMFTNAIPNLLSVTCELSGTLIDPI